jgi:hypothetical protein
MKSIKGGQLIAPCTMLLFMLAFLCTPAAFGATDETEERAPGRTMADQATRAKKLWITTDHSRIEALQKDFRSGPEVTQACLSCHTEAADQFHKTIHWTWKAYTTEMAAFTAKAAIRSITSASRPTTCRTRAA